MTYHNNHNNSNLINYNLPPFTPQCYCPFSFELSLKGKRERTVQKVTDCCSLISYLKKDFTLEEH